VRKNISLSSEGLFVGAPPEYWDKLVRDSMFFLSKVAHCNPTLHDILRKEYKAYKDRCRILKISAYSYERWSAVYLKVHYELSQSEKRILKLVALGFSNQAIAVQEHLALDTVKSHMRNIFKKLNLQAKYPESKDLSPRVICSQFVSLMSLSCS